MNFPSKKKSSKLMWTKFHEFFIKYLNFGIFCNEKKNSSNGNKIWRFFLLFALFLGIYDDVGLKPTCVQFVPSSEHHLLVGNESGELQLFDIRKPKNCIVKNDMTEKAVSKIKFSPSLKNTFGVCSETSSLRVFTLDQTLSSLDIK